MQTAMDRLAGFLERRRWAVLVAWVLVLVAALSFAAKQTEQLAVVLARREGAGAAAVRDEVDRLGRIAAELPHVELTPRASAAAKRAADSASITVVPLAVNGDRDQTADMAVDFRDSLGTEPRAGIE